MNLGVAHRVDPVFRLVPAPRTNYRQNGSKDFSCCILNFADNSVVLFPTSAVRVSTPHTGESTLAYAQYDAASQVTLLSDVLKNELRLETNSDWNVKIRILADETMDCKGCSAFTLESLHTGEKFVIKDALVVPLFSDDVRTLLHSVDFSTLEHFNCIDILIGQSDKQLLIILEECEGAIPAEPCYVLTGLGPTSGRGKVPSAIPGSLSALRVQVDSYKDSA